LSGLLPSINDIFNWYTVIAVLLTIIIVELIMVIDLLERQDQRADEQRNA